MYGGKPLTERIPEAVKGEARDKAGRAVKYAQICSGSKVDSLIGPNTIQAINKTEPNKFCYQFLMECVEGYVSLVNRDDSQRAFLLGWMRRVVGAYYQVRE